MENIERMMRIWVFYFCISPTAIRYGGMWKWRTLGMVPFVQIKFVVGLGWFCHMFSCY